MESGFWCSLFWVVEVWMIDCLYDLGEIKKNTLVMIFDSIEKYEVKTAHKLIILT